jgi:hypothetical protein
LCLIPSFATRTGAHADVADQASTVEAGPRPAGFGTIYRHLVDFGDNRGGHFTADENRLRAADSGGPDSFGGT